MTERRRKLEELGSGVEMRLLRERLGLPKYRKQRERDAEKRRLLLELWLRQIERAERDDFLPLGPRRRRVRIL